MKTPEEYALSLTNDDNDFRGYTTAERVITQIIADARAAERERCAEIADRFASGHHFAGDLAGEKSYRRCIEAIKGEDHE